MEEGILNSKIACSLERKDLVLIQQKAVSGVEWVRDAEMWEETQFGKSLTHQSWRGGRSAFLHHSGLWPGIGQQPHKYRVGQKVHLGFSIRCSRKTLKNFFANPVLATVVKNLPAHAGDMGLIPGLEKGMATHSSILACEIP